MTSFFYCALPFFSITDAINVLCFVLTSHGARALERARCERCGQIQTESSSALRGVAASLRYVSGSGRGGRTRLLCHYCPCQEGKLTNELNRLTEYEI